jgi:hypothetical protein
MSTGSQPPTVWDGLVVTLTAATVTSFSFYTSMVGGPTNPVNSVQHVLGVQNLFIEANVVELAQATSGTLIGVHVQDGGADGIAQDANPAYATYIFDKVAVRDNKTRYVDGYANNDFKGYGLNLQSAKALLVRNNVVDAMPANPVRTYRCGSVDCLNNLTAGAVLIQGYNANTTAYYEEISTEADFAEVMSMMNRS